ncbi:MAG: amidohydrolase family protein [Longimicrobiales bacterium]|nr:amidohydrolase family protein [Longimicrobiales bacterium]
MRRFRLEQGRWAGSMVFLSVIGALFLALGFNPAQAQSVAITNGEVHTVSGPVIPGGTVLVVNGVITAVGRDVTIPSGVRVLDATGKVVTPGFFDSSTRLGVVEIGSYEGTSDGSSANDRMTAAFNVAEGINPNSTLFPVARVEGITRAVVAPTPGVSLIAGTSALINLGEGSLSGMLDKTPLAMYAVLGESGASYEGGSRPLALLRLREVFQDALDFAENRGAFDAGNRRDYSLSRLDLEALVPVVRGELPLVLQVNRASDILTALTLKDEFGLVLVLSGVGEGWMVAEEIAAAGVPVMTNAISNMPSMEILGAGYENVARMNQAGVTVILSSFDAHNVRNLKQEAGFAVAYGLPYEVALQAVTLTPAQVWGVADRMGSLEPGKVGDVVVWSGDPFEVMVSAQAVFIDGVEISYETRQKALLEKYRNLQNVPPWR